MRIIKWISENILFLCTLLLLVVIPLYPKIPLFDVVHTWVYIRVEDFLVALVLLLWVILLLLKRVTLKTPLTLPILLFWIIGGIATLHGVLLIFPTISDVFPNVALLSFLRRIEYLSLFFVAFAGIRDKKFIYYVIATLVVVLLIVVGYGVGQKFLGFPAYLTMNEEFAKGTPIQLSQLSRVPSTFAGHYDLAAYLVLIIPLLVSLIFGFKNILIKTILLITAVLGFGLLFMTVSRVSFFVLSLSLVFLLILQKKRLLIASVFIVFLLFLSLAPSLLSRFGNTVTEVDVLVDAKTGEAIGHVKESSSQIYEKKTIKKTFYDNRNAVYGFNTDHEDKLASPSAIIPFSQLEPRIFVLAEPNTSTGENLPQGTGYINLHLSPIKNKPIQFFYQIPPKEGEAPSEDVYSFYGNFLVKRAKAYDLSFTTRFQGEWPKTIAAFKRNIFLGSGYGSVSLAVDNNYLRILGESGLLGFISFGSIFLIACIYIKKILPKVDSPVARSFILGFFAGTFGLMLNAVLIDVFEASKIAFSYWLLMGVTLGLLHLYKSEEIDLLGEFKKVLISSYAVVIYLFILTVVLFYSASSYYFVGDDFTWFRWIADGKNGVISYFADANGFFYRPGAKLYFSTMYSIFWLNQNMYHFVSIGLHFLVTMLIFIITKKILKDPLLSAVGAVLFLILSGFHEAVFWISATGFLFSSLFTFLSLLFFIYWKEKQSKIFLVGSLISIIFSLLFHELGVVVPLLVILYDIVFRENRRFGYLPRRIYLVLLSPLLPYLALRFLAHSHWFSGDYSYNLLKLPFNFVGNIIGYLLLGFLGPSSMVLSQALRNFSRENIVFAMLMSIALILLGFVVYRVLRKLELEDKKLVIFGTLFFIISLLPFLGLGNIASRYGYLSSFGLVLLLVFSLKKLYMYLFNNGKQIALACIIIVCIIFSIIHLFQLQKIHTDWFVAGEKSKKTLISLNEIYAQDLIQDNMRFYFVNVPIRNGEAWVFPVGLEDIVWFVFQEKNISIHKVASVEEALHMSDGLSTERILEFQDNGSIKRIYKRKLTDIQTQ